MSSLLLTLLPLALGLAASPLPVLGVIVILLTKRARGGSIAFLVAWVCANALTLGVALALGKALHPPRGGIDPTAEAIATLVAGVALLVAGWVSHRRRVSQPREQGAPRWVAAVQNLSPVSGVLLAVSNATTSPKNLTLAIAAAVAISTARVLPALKGAAAFFYVLIGSVTVAIPVVLYWALGARAVAILERWKDFITENAAGIVEGVMLIAGVGLSIKAIIDLL